MVDVGEAQGGRVRCYLAILLLCFSVRGLFRLENLLMVRCYGSLIGRGEEYIVVVLI